METGTRMVVDGGGDGAEEEETTGMTEGVSTMGMAEVKIWVLEAKMWVIVVVEVEVQVVVTYLVAAWAEEAARRRVRRVGWRIVASVYVDVARERFGGALWFDCGFCDWCFVVRARWDSWCAQWVSCCDATVCVLR